MALASDNLTLKLKEDFDRRAREQFTTQTKPQLGGASPAATGSLWESLETGEVPKWLDIEDFDYESNLGLAVGKGMWAAFDTTTFGLAGLGVRQTLGQEAWRALQPRTFGERVASGIGTVGGFMLPMGWARGVAGIGLKGVKVADKAGKTIGMGSKVATAKYTDNVVRILKGDKEFLSWAASKGMGPDDITKWIKESDLVKEGANAIGKMGTWKGSKFFSNQSLRTAYVKNVDETIDTIIRGKVSNMKQLWPGQQVQTLSPGRYKSFEDLGRAATTETRGAFGVSEKAVDLVGKEVRKYIGGKYNTPITDLHKVFALKFGNGKWGNIAASAAEEALLFAAVELPMNFFNSLGNEDVDLAPLGTLGHALALGSALGMVKLVPGGNDMSILKSGFSKMKQSLSTRKRWSKFDVTKESDRILLVNRAKNLMEDQKSMFNTLKTKRGSLEKFVTENKDLDGFIGSASKAKELKTWMVDLESAFMKDWWPQFRKQAMEDLTGSSRRVILGSLAFNVGTLNSYFKGELPVEDLVFHTLLGAVLSKKGRTLEYKDAKGKTVKLPADDRPYYNTEKFEKTDKYLKTLGMDLDHAAWRNVVDNLETLKEHGQPNLSHDDMVKLVKVLENHNFFIGKDVEPKFLQEEGIEAGEVFKVLHSIAESKIRNEEVDVDNMTTRVKSYEEFTVAEVQALMAELKDTNFKSLDEYRTKANSYKGIGNRFDLFDLVHASSDAHTKKSIEIWMNALEDAYLKMYEIEAMEQGLTSDEAPRVRREKDANGNETGRLILREIDYSATDIAGGRGTDRMLELFGGRGDSSDNNSALGILKNRVVVTRANPIVFTSKMKQRLFGSKDTDRGIMGEHDLALTKQFLGDDVSIDETNLLTIGMPTHRDVMRSALFRQAVQTTYTELGRIRDYNPQKPMDTRFGEDATEVKRLISLIFPEAGMLPEKIVVEDAGKVQVKADNPAQRFASDLLQVLRGDINYNQQRTDLLPSPTVKAREGEVNRLIQKFKDSNLFSGFDRMEGDRDADVRQFVDRLASYTFEKTLGSATRNDGTSLTPKDYAILTKLQDLRLIGPAFNMAVLQDYIGNVKSTLLKLDTIKQHHDRIRGMSDVELSSWVNRNLDTVQKAFNNLEEVGLRDTDLSFYQTFKALADASGESQAVGYLIGDYLKLINETLAPLIKNDATGHGILKFTDVQALPTHEAMFRLLTEFKAIESGAMVSSFESLRDATMEMHGGTNNPEIKSFMGNVLNNVLHKAGNTTRAIQVLKKYKLFNTEDGAWLVSESTPNLKDRLNKAAHEIDMITQPLTTEYQIRLMTERDKIDFIPKHESDLDVSMTFDKLLNDWGVILPEIGDNNAMDVMFESLGKDGGDFTLKRFEDYIIDHMIGTKEIDGRSYDKNDWKEMPQKDKEKFGSDMVKVWESLNQTKSVRRIKLAESSRGISEAETLRRNDLSDLLEELFGEVAFVDFNYRLSDGNSFNVQRSSRGTMEKFIKSLHEVAVKKEARITMETDYPVDPKDVEQNGYFLATFGDLDYGIAIPRVAQPSGNLPLTGVHKLSDAFVKVLYKALERGGIGDRNKDIGTRINQLLDKYVINDKSRIVDNRKPQQTVDGDTVGPPPAEGEYLYRYPYDAKKDVSGDLSLMLHVVFGHNKMGDMFWETVGNTKRDTKGWVWEKEFAHDFMRRVRLMSNGTTLKLRREGLRDISSFWRDTIGVSSDTEGALNVVDRLASTGNFRMHIVRDESDLASLSGNRQGRHPSASSALETYRNQLVAENANVAKDDAGNPLYNILQLEGGERGFTFPGELGDTSHFNSVSIVSKDFMTALKLGTGDFFRTESTANKPIISFSDSGNRAFLGKTMFVVDSNFDGYLSRNKVDVVTFGSAAKGFGSHYRNNVIDMSRFADIPEFLAYEADQAATTINMPVEAIGIQMWNQHNKPARIPMHVGADLVGKDLNDAYFNWLIRKTTDRWHDEAGVNLNNGSIDAMIAESKLLFGINTQDVDNNTYGTISEFMKVDMYPQFLPWRRAQKNAMMHHYIEKMGMFSPMNESGGQSVVAPGYFGYNRDGSLHPDALKGTSFHTEVDGTRRVYSYGQGEAAAESRTKPIGRNLEIILHDKKGPDEIVQWNTFVKQIRGLARDRIKALEEVRSGLAPGAERTSIEREIRELGLNVMEARLEKFQFTKNGNYENQIGKVYDYLQRLKKTDFLKEATDVEFTKEKVIRDLNDPEIAVVYHRTPSLKSSDKVILGLKKFNTDGNIAKVNTKDFWTRLEGDHDYDKVSYWWDTPHNILMEWDKNSGNILAVTDNSPKTSLENLSLDNPNSLVDYNLESATATWMRGPVVKARRLIQWLQHYQGRDQDLKTRGFNIVIGKWKNTRIAFDNSMWGEIDRRLAKDAQRIIDSKDGYERESFDDDYLKNLLFGKAGWTDSQGASWRGVFKVSKRARQSDDWRDASVTLSDIQKDALLEVVKPYRNFLQLSTDIYDGGTAKKVDYETLKSGFEAYKDVLENLNMHVYKKLEKKGYTVGQLDELFGAHGFKELKKDPIIDVQGRFPKPGLMTSRSMVGSTDGLLPYDRAVWAAVSLDRLFVEKPKKELSLAREDFDNMWSRGLKDGDEVSAVSKSIINKIEKQASTLSYLNVLENKINRLENSIFAARKYKNQDMEDTFVEKKSKLEEIRNRVNEAVIIDEKAAGSIKKSIINQMSRALMQGDFIKLSLWDKKARKWKHPKPISFKSTPWGKRKKEVQKLLANGTLSYNAWRHPNKVIRIKGFNSNEYAQLVMWHQTMTEFTGFALDPKEYTFAQQFETDILDARYKIAENWGKFKSNDGTYMPNEREDIVAADNMRYIKGRYDAWEATEPGLGMLFLFKFMTPKPSGTTFTYQRGKYLPGFEGGSKAIAKEQKYMNLGLNFINQLDVPEVPMLKAYARKTGIPWKFLAQPIDRKRAIFQAISDSFTNKMRVAYGQTKVEELAIPRSAREVIEGSLGNGAMDFKLVGNDASRQTQENFYRSLEDIYPKISETDLDNVSLLNKEILDHYQMTGSDISLDYLSMRGAPPGISKMYDIKTMADFYFRPYKVLNRKGRLQSVKNLNSFYGFMKNDALIFYGKHSGKNMLTAENTAHIDINALGGNTSSRNESATDMKQTARTNWLNLNCG